MKVYVEKLPKYCADNCPCFKYNEYWDEYYCGGGCEIEDKYKKPKTYPLQTLSDYIKQVRKEVCEEIRKSSPRKYEAIDDMYYCISSSFLDQIQGKGE